MQKKSFNFDPYLLITAGITCVLRFFNLGYSNYQGDEIRALWMESNDQYWVEFLLNQKKGPMQFLITRLTRIINPDHANELITRLPFTIMAVISVIIFYLLIRALFGKKVAFYSSLFMATNGIFVGLARIAQYQSGGIMFSLLCVYLFWLAGEKPRFRIWGIFLGMASIAISLLFHYDGILIAPIALYALGHWFVKYNRSIKAKITIVISAGLVGLAMLLVFYIPFILNVSDSTMQYWDGRINGLPGLVYATLPTFLLYQPFLTYPLYIGCFILGVFFFWFPFIQKYFQERTPLHSYLMDEHLWQVIAVFSWFCLSYWFMESFIIDPGTHIYTYLIPLMVIMGGGVCLVEDFLCRIHQIKLPVWIGKTAYGLLAGGCFLFLTLQSWMIFVDHTPEYPWNAKQFLWLTLPKIEYEVYEMKVFGFPYQRGWEEIQEILKDYPEETCSGSNEREVIVSYYTKLSDSSTCAGFYFVVTDPQSHEKGLTGKARYWTGKYDPDYVVENENGVMIKAYMMAPGSLDEIQAAGY